MGWYPANSAKLVIISNYFQGNNYAVKGGGFYGEGFRELTISHSGFIKRNRDRICHGTAGGGHMGTQDISK